MEDAIDDWILRQIHWLRRDDVIARGIQWVQDVRIYINNSMLYYCWFILEKKIYIFFSRSVPVV